ncbi:WD40/YVTN/BNR-like repeat-containing protein [Nannocystaceae bacterium ST9]
MDLRAATRVWFAALGLGLGTSCGDDDEAEAETEAADAPAAEGEAPATDGKIVPDSVPTPANTGGPERFQHWSPLHAFVQTPVIAAEVIGEREAIVATRDAHVALTRDGGQTWIWARAPQPVVGVAGYAGGPYVLLHPGALSLSSDGRVWAPQPRWTNDVLIDVLASELGLFAIGRGGTWLHFARDGGGGQVGVLPDGFRPLALGELNGAVLAWSGKQGYGTTDAATWTALESVPSLFDGRSVATSAGRCVLAKATIACAVEGMAHGVGAEILVENKGAVALSRDAGKTWINSALPFAGANAIFGTPGGPYWAIGKGGKLASSSEGLSWNDLDLDEPLDLVDGMVDGDLILIVGSKGTIMSSRSGGSEWSFAEPPVGKNFSWVGKSEGRYMASDGRAFVTSSDASEWVEVGAVPLPASPGSCSPAPADGERCRWSTRSAVPEDLPAIRGFDFEADVGLAYGDDGLIAMTHDGGATWTVERGLGLGPRGATALHLRGTNMLATNGARLVVSTDGGATWKDGQMAGAPRFFALRVSEGGTWIAAGSELLTAKSDPTLWTRPEAIEPAKATWQAIHETAGAIYLAGTKGELSRSDEGTTWTAVLTGEPTPVIAMAGEGDRVWAATAYGRKSNNVLLRSDDGGRHFARVHEMADATDEPDLAWSGGALHWRDLVSHDEAASWKRERENYFPAAVPVADGSGMAIVNRVLSYSPDRLYLVTGPGEHDWLRIDAAQTEGGTIQCDAELGCVMLAGGVIYRPSPP